MVKKILGIDPGHGQDDLKGLTSYICMNFMYHIKICVCVCKLVFSYLCNYILYYYKIVRVCVITSLK
jgi:hypothetical protein